MIELLILLSLSWTDVEKNLSYLNIGLAVADIYTTYDAGQKGYSEGNPLLREDDGLPRVELLIPAKIIGGIAIWYYLDNYVENKVPALAALAIIQGLVVTNNITILYLRF